MTYNFKSMGRKKGITSTLSTLSTTHSTKGISLKGSNVEGSTTTTTTTTTTNTLLQEETKRAVADPSSARGGPIPHSDFRKLRNHGQPFSVVPWVWFGAIPAEGACHLLAAALLTQSRLQNGRDEGLEIKLKFRQIVGVSKDKYQWAAARLESLGFVRIHRGGSGNKRYRFDLLVPDSIQDDLSEWGRAFKFGDY